LLAPEETCAFQWRWELAMRLGRESLILVAVPVLFLACAWCALMPGDEPHLGSVHPEGFDSGTRGSLGAGWDEDRDSAESLSAHSGGQDQAAVVGNGDATEFDSRARLDAGDEDSLSRGTAGKGEKPALNRDGGADESGRRSPFRGRLVDADGRAVTSGVIVVRERRNLFDARGRSVHQDVVALEIPIGPDGGFEIPRRVGYVYTVHVHATGFAGTTANLYVSTSPLITLQRPAEVRGYVVDSFTGNPVSGATVRIFTSSTSSVAESAHDGSYVFPSLSPSPAWMEVVHPEYAVARVQVGSLHSGDVVRRDFLLQPGISLAGRVVVRGSGAPPEGPVTVRAFDMSRQLFAGSILAAPDGSFELSTLYPDSLYALTVSAPEYGETIVTVQTPQVGHVISPLTIVIDQPWTLNGRVTDSSGLPVAGVKVTLRGTGEDASLPPVIAVSDAAGVFTASGLGAASYRLIAFHSQYVTRTIDDINRVAHEHEILGITLVRGATVEGSLQGPSGPVRSAVIEVLVRDPLTGDPVGPAFFSHAREDGTFTILQVPLGDVTLKVLAAGFEQAEDQFLLSAQGQTVHRIITLQPAGGSGGR